MRWSGLALFFLLAAPVSAADITVCASGCTYNNSQLQTAIDAAACGDTIKLQDGASYVGNFQLKTKNPCTSYTTLTRTGALPGIYDVIEGCYQLGPTFVAEMAKKAACFAALKTQYETNAPRIYVTHAMQDLTFGTPLNIGFDADYWHIQGLHIYTEGTSLGGGLGGVESSGLITIGFDQVTGANATTASQIPHHIKIDRVSIHGTVGGSTKRCIYANANTIEFTNSLCYNIHVYGQDAQALISVNGNGPFWIENNFSEVAGEDYLFGGSDPTVPLALPSDITQTRNYMTSDWTWWDNCARLNTEYGYPCTYVGLYWQIKNKTECKNCQRNDIYGNVIEGSWQVDQPGNLILMQSIPNGPDCAHCTVSDVNIYNNVIRHGGQGVSIAGWGGGATFQLMGARFDVSNNLIYGIRSMYSASYTSGECFHIKSGSNGSAAVDVLDEVTIDHNTCDNNAGSWMLLQDNPDRFTDLVITNNIGKARSDFGAVAVPQTNGGTQGFDTVAPGSYTVSNNAILTHATEWPWPANNWFGVTGDETATLDAYEAIFVDLDASDYTVAPGSLYKAGGARDSLTGTDLGVDMSLLPLGAEVIGEGAPTFRMRFRSAALFDGLDDAHTRHVRQPLAMVKQPAIELVDGLDRRPVQHRPDVRGGQRERPHMGGREVATDAIHFGIGQRALARRDVVLGVGDALAEDLQGLQRPNWFAKDGASAWLQDTRNLSRTLLNVQVVQDHNAEDHVYGLTRDRQRVGRADAPLRPWAHLRSLLQQVGRDVAANHAGTHPRQHGTVLATPTAKVQHGLAAHVSHEMEGVFQVVGGVSGWRQVALDDGFGQRVRVGVQGRINGAAVLLGTFPRHQVHGYPFVSEGKLTLAQRSPPTLSDGR